MSFGFSVGDIILLAQLTGRAYTNWKNACGDYTEITGQLNSLNVILRRLDTEREAPQSLLGRDDADYDGLLQILENSKTTVTQLSNVITKFKSLGRSRKSNWDRLRLANKDLADLRSKLTLHISALTTYLETLGVSALGRIESSVGESPEMRKAIDRIASEMRAGKREGSVISVMTAYEDDDQRVWRELRRELIGDGFSSGSIQRCKPRLKQYIRSLHERGLLDEDAPPSPTESLDEDIFRHGRLPTSPNLPAANLHSAKDQTRASSSVTGKKPFGPSLEEATLIVQVGGDVHSSINNVTNREIYSPNQSSRQGSNSQLETVPCPSERPNMGKDPTTSFEVEKAFGDTGDSDAKRHEQDNPEIVGPEKEDMSKCDEIHSVETSTRDIAKADRVKEGTRGHYRLDLATEDNDEHQKAEDVVEKDIFEGEAIYGESGNSNCRQLELTESLKQLASQQTSDSGSTDTLSTENLVDLPASPCGLRTGRDDAEGLSNDRHQDTIRKRRLLQTSAVDRETSSSACRNVLDIRQTPDTHRPSASEIDMKFQEGHPCINCWKLREDKMAQRPPHDDTCDCNASVPTGGWTSFNWRGYGTWHGDEWADADEWLSFPLPPTAEMYPNSPLPPGWTRVETPSGRIYWQHESSLFSYVHPGYSDYIAFGCDKHVTCMRICGHSLDNEDRALERKWEYFDHDVRYRYGDFIICSGNLACQMTPESLVKRPRPKPKARVGTPADTGGTPPSWLQIHTLDGRICSVRCRTGNKTYVDPRWSSPGEFATNPTPPKMARILDEWHYELPKDWEQHHDEEGRIYFTKSDGDAIVTTWVDPRWKDSWDKFQRARQQNERQIKPPPVILAGQANKPARGKERQLPTIFRLLFS
jgi:hypothetical protein